MTTSVELPIAARNGTIARCDLLKALEADPRFRRDSLLGGIFHLGRISYREVSSTDSLHIVILGDKVSAHVDEISPLRLRADGSSRYAWGQVLAHNLLVLIGDTARRIRGRHGEQRCNLHCQMEWFDDSDGDHGACDEHDHDHDHEAA